jgi:hypothetical protein
MQVSIVKLIVYCSGQDDTANQNSSSLKFLLGSRGGSSKNQGKNK